MTELAAVLTNSGAPGARPRNSSSARSPRRPPASNAVTAYRVLRVRRVGEGGQRQRAPPAEPTRKAGRSTVLHAGRARGTALLPPGRCAGGARRCDRDTVIPIAHTLAAHDLLPTSKLELFAGAGHHPTSNNPCDSLTCCTISCATPRPHRRSVHAQPIAGP